MTAPIPQDVESCEQWQVRWEGPIGREVKRNGTEAQVRFVARQHAEFQPVIEKRTITVGQWRNPDAPEPSFDSNALEAEDDDAADE